MPVKSSVAAACPLACVAAAFTAATVSHFTAAPAFAEEPIKIGFGMSLTGPLAANGKMSLVAMQVWEADVNAPAACSAGR